MSRLESLNLECDRRVLLIVALLMLVGASLVASSSSYFAASKFDDPYYLLKRHLVRLVIAALFLYVAAHIDYRVFRRLSPAAFGIGLVLLLGLFIFGHTIRDTVRWYTVARLQMTVQPAELTRLSLVFFIAFWVARKGADIEKFREGFLPVAVALTTVIGLLALQPNYGSATATVLIGFIMLFLGGARLTHLTGLAGTLLAVGFIRIASVGYVRDRIATYLHRGDAVDATNWQPFQSLVALGAGGIFGSGVGESRQKLHWLPDSHTDFIFSILGEEMGLIGTIAISTMFLLIALRALKISRRSEDRFGEMLAIGIGSSIFVYAMLNMFVVTGLFPVTGLPLPFVSYGGSALVVNALSVGVLLNISKRAMENGPQTRRGVPLRPASGRAAKRRVRRAIA